MGPLSLCPFGTSKSKRNPGHHNAQQQQQQHQQQQQQPQQQHQPSRHINNMTNTNTNTNNNININTNVLSNNNNITSNNNNIISNGQGAKTNNTMNTLSSNPPLDIKQNVNIRHSTKSKFHHQLQQQASNSPMMHPNRNGYLQSPHNQALTPATLSATSNRHRYVMSDFEPKVHDEIRVVQGDVVYFEYSDVEESGQSWAHVVCIRNNERGFVPTSLLTNEPVQPVQFKKKLPRSTPPTGLICNSHNHHLNHHHHILGNQNNLMPIEYHNSQDHHAAVQHQINLIDNNNMINNHTSSNHHDRLSPINSYINNNHNNNITNHNPLQLQKTLLNGPTGQLSCNSENIQPHRHTFNHQPRFGISHSLQGSSGKQSFQKSCDSTHMGPPSYNHCLAQPLDLIPFYHDHNETFVVLFNFVAREENDLSVRPGDYLIVLNKDDPDWYWVRREDDKIEGFVPAKFICEYEQAKSMLNKGNSISSVRSSSNQQSNDLHTYINHKPEKESTLTNTDQHSSLFHP